LNEHKDTRAPETKEIIKKNEDTTSQSSIASISHSFFSPRIECRLIREALLIEKTLLMHPNYKLVSKLISKLISKLVSQVRL
jgi:hypothetical protein